MSALPAARFLLDLGSDGAAARPPPETDRAASEAARLEEAYARGHADGTAAARAESEVKLAEAARAHAEALAAERARWAEAEGARLAGSLASGLAAAQAAIAEAAARVLKPFLPAALHRRAIEDLVESLAVLLTGDRRVAIAISGPQDLLDALRRHMDGKAAAAVTYAVCDTSEVRVSVDQAVLETNLAAWARRLEEGAP